MNSIVHGQKTREWASEVGFPARMAHAIAEADLVVDVLRLPRNLYHMRPPLLLGRDRRAEVAEEHLARARGAADGGDCEAVCRNLGYGLHALQDRASHGGWWLLGIHWGKWFDDPGRTLWGSPDRRQRRLKSVERVTKHYLRRAVADPDIGRCMRDAGATAA